MKMKRQIWIDALNIMACSGVLLLHSTNGELHNFSGTHTVNWFIGLFTHSFFLWPVNVFFMLSGYTLLRKELIEGSLENTTSEVKLFYKRRLNRLLVPLISWNIFYMLIYLARKAVNNESLDSIWVLIKKFCLFEYNGFMWFFVPLILIYLSLPFFAYFVLNAPQKLLRLYLIIGLMLGWIPAIDPMFNTRSSFADIYLMGSRFLYFIVAGVYLGKYELSYLFRKRLYIATIASMLLIFIGIYILTLFSPSHYKFFLCYTNIPCTISAFGVFVFFRHVDWNKVFSKFHITTMSLAKFSSLSLGIYLIQAAWFMTLSHFDICNENIILRFIVMYILCICSVYVMQRIPIIKKMV